ncbi:MAG: DUF2505 domain-containing protein [Pauljensenia sp.]
MEFTQSICYPASADEVVAMYLAPAYLERRFGAFLVEGSARIRVEGQRITLDGECRPELIPAAAARFVASPLRVTFTEEWASDEARARSRSSVTVDGAPVSVEATSTLAASEGGCTREVVGSVSVRVPLLGGRIEREAVARLGGVANREEELAAAWLEEHR